MAILQGFLFLEFASRTISGIQATSHSLAATCTSPRPPPLPASVPPTSSTDQYLERQPGGGGQRRRGSPKANIPVRREPPPGVCKPPMRTPIPPTSCSPARERGIYMRQARIHCTYPTRCRLYTVTTEKVTWHAGMEFCSNHSLVPFAFNTEQRSQDLASMKRRRRSKTARHSISCSRGVSLTPPY